MRCDLFSNVDVLGVPRVPPIVNSTTRTDHEQAERSD